MDNKFLPITRFEIGGNIAIVVENKHNRILPEVASGRICFNIDGDVVVFSFMLITSLPKDLFACFNLMKLSMKFKTIIAEQLIEHQNIKCVAIDFSR